MILLKLVFLFVFLLIPLVANLALWGLPLILLYAALRFLGRRSARIAAVAITSAVACAIPIALNSVADRERSELRRDDRLPERPLAGLHAVAFLLEQGGSTWRQSCDLTCQLLLYRGEVASLFIANPTKIFTFDPQQPVTRYHIQHRPYCPDAVKEFSAGSENWEIRLHKANGDCLVEEAGLLGDAEAVVTVRNIRETSGAWSAPAIDVWRLEVSVRRADAFRLVYRQSAVGGSDLVVPLLLGNTPFGYLGVPRFGLSQIQISASLPDVDHWINESSGLVTGTPIRSRRGPEDPKILQEVRESARRIVGDPSIPAGTAAAALLSQFLFEHVSDPRDIDLNSAIIRDNRVRIYRDANRQIPVALAEPILDRVLSDHPVGQASDPAAAQELQQTMDGLASLFLFLPPCAAKPLRSRLLEVAHDPGRRSLAASMLARLADAGPTSAADLVDLIEAALDGPWQGSGISQYDFDPPVKNLIVAGLAGLGRLGPTAAGILPRLDQLLARVPRGRPLMGIAMPLANAYKSMGKPEELKSVVQQYAPNQVNSILWPGNPAKVDVCG